MTKIEKAKALGLSFVASAIVATSASAGISSLDINNSINVAHAKAALSAVAVNVGPSETTRIKLVGVSTSGANGTIKLALTNGDFNKSDYNLSTNATCLAGSVTAAATTVATTSTELFFTLNQQVTNQDLYLCNGLVGAAKMELNMTKSLAVGATTTMTATVNDGISTAAYPSKTLGTVVDNFTGATKVTASSTIDVNQDRKKFVVSGQTALTSSGDANVSATLGGDTGYQATVNKVRLTVTGDLTGASTFTSGAGTYTITAADKAAGYFTVTATAAAGTDSNISNGKLAVDGTTTLGTRTLTGQVSVSTDGTTYTNAGTSMDVMTWTINGFQGNIPYLSSTADTTTYIKLNNNHTVDAIVSFDATDDAGTRITNLTVNKAGASTSGLTAGQAGLWSAADILTAARASGQTGAATFAADNKFRVTATVTAPTAKVYGVAIQQISGGRDRMIPIFTTSTAVGDYMQH